MKTIATLFSGFEGIGVGARAAGYSHLWGVEFDPKIAHVAETNGFRSIVADVREVDFSSLERPDHLHASPVCKNASIAKINGKESTDDADTAAAVVRAITVLRPNTFTLENVRGYVNFAAFDLIVRSLREHGYGVCFSVLNAANYGVPQTRERLILRAVHGVSDRGASLPLSTHARRDLLTPMFETRSPWVGWLEAVADLVDDLPETKFAPWQLRLLPKAMDASLLVHNNDMRTMPVRRETDPAFTITAASNNTRAPSTYPKAYIVCGMSNKNGKEVTVRLGDEPAFVVTSQTGARQSVRAQVKGRVVRMTPRALARFQSFPDSYQLPDVNRISVSGIGNAVPPLLMQKVLYANV